MFEHDHIELYKFEEIPLEEECFLMDESYMSEYETAVIDMLDNDGDYPNVGYISYVVARKLNENSVELSWYPNLHTRFHEVSITLPKEQFVNCVGCWRYDLKTHIFVNHEWLEKLYVREYSVFALVDAIGVKSALQNGTLSKDKLISLRDEIDALAKQYPEISFISFADSLILKSNWSVGYFKKDIKCDYEPETFINVVKKLQDIYIRVLGLDVYAVLTQGSNEYYEESLLHISESENHISLNSLGVPFAELMAIDHAARAAIKAGLHAPSELYMDEQFYHSLNFKSGFDKNAGDKSCYDAIMKSGKNHYFYSGCEQIFNNLVIRGKG